MGALTETKMSAAEFLDWNVSQGDKRFELERGKPLELSAETARHALTKHEVVKELERGIDLAHLECRVFPDGMQIIVDDETVRIPDAAVQCGPFDMEGLTLDKPVILIEVMSPSSVNRDEKHKLLEYFQLPSVQHYLLLAPSDRYLIHFQRTDDPEKLDTRFVREGQIDLIPPGFKIDVDRIFAEVDR